MRLPLHQQKSGLPPLSRVYPQSSPALQHGPACHVSPLPSPRAHQEASQAFAQVAAQRERAGGRGRGVDTDPWLSEGQLVEQQVRLQRAQAAERAYLASAFHRVGDLERRRAAAAGVALSRFVQIYRSAVVPIQEIAGARRGRGGQGTLAARWPGLVESVPPLAASRGRPASRTVCGCAHLACVLCSAAPRR